MNFTSAIFLVFFPLVLLGNRLCPQRRRWALLLAASYTFYGYTAPATLWLLVAVTATTWLAARRLAAAPTAVARKVWLAVGCGVPLAFLAVFKYADFTLHLLTGRSVALGLLLPVGISFYTFQTLSYVVDVWRGSQAPEPHFGYYALFVSFFPQLVAGPIERPGHLLPQLRAARTPGWADLEAGVRPLLRGFAKKLVVADYLATLVEPVYAAPGQATAPAVLVATALFALQIYCDFSGYCDIAVGVAAMLGIRLTQNFNHPYAGTTIREFWRRWHISLSGWFADYLYKPLGGSRKGLARHCINLMLVFLVSGLWHGAGWHFVAWGALHGLYLVAGTLYRRFVPQGRIPALPPRLGQLRTFALACLAWVFFRAANLPDAFALLAALGRWQPGGLTLLGVQPVDLLRLPAVLLLLGVMEQNDKRPAQTPAAPAALTVLRLYYPVTLIALGWLALLVTGGGGAFLYFQF